MKRIATGLGMLVIVSAVFFGEEFANPTSALVFAATEGTGAALAEVKAPSGALIVRDRADLSGSRQAAEAPAARPPSASVPGTANCPDGMQEVEGDYCPYLEQKCLRWLDPDTKMRCAEFAPTGACEGKTAHKHFCIDRYEYPNKVGEKPVVMQTWYDARNACQAQGKRLCGDSEWTLACEGQERLPYPYGYVRDADACNIDKPHPDPNEKLIADPRTRDAEVARLDQRDASGAREACVSPYGVHDMTGNVDEWVVNESGHPYQSGLKGGYWGPVRTRCRPMTTAHYEEFAFYQIGFRCCAETESTDATTLTTKVKGGPKKAATKASVAGI